MHAHAQTKEITAECPCVGHCTTVLGDDVCRSCLRTFEEVTRWPGLTDEERIQINRRIAVERCKRKGARGKVQEERCKVQEKP